MDTKEVLKVMRVKINLTQDEMAEKLFVTRQAVSRWENGYSTPDIETLKQISAVLIYLSIHCSGIRDSLFVSDAECRWRMTLLSARKLITALMRTLQMVLYRREVRI